MVKKHNKPSAESPDGGIVEMEGTVHVSNLMVVDSSGTASRIKRGKNEKGNSIRVSVKTGEEIK
jgi:large subunit ribosomal protein L24